MTPFLAPPTRNPTGSRLALADTCIGSAAQGQVEETEEDETPAKTGRIIHKFQENVTNVGREEALALAPDDHRAGCAVIDQDLMPVDPAQYAAEVAFAWDAFTDTAREIGRGLERGYGELGPLEVAATADVVALMGNDGVAIIDYKTGHSRIAPARRNWQLLFLALCAARRWGRTRARVQIIRLREDGSAWTDTADLDANDLERVADLTRLLLARFRAARAVYAERGEIAGLTVGSHCTRCQARRICPAQGYLISRLAADPEKVMSEVAGMLNPAGALRATEVIKAIEGALAVVKSQLYLYALSNPIDMGDGYVYGPMVVKTDHLDGEKVYEAMLEMVGPGPAKETVELKATKARIDEALKRLLQVPAAEPAMYALAVQDEKHKGKPKLAPILRTVYRKLAAAGALWSTSERKVRAHKVKPPLVGPAPESEDPRPAEPA